MVTGGAAGVRGQARVEKSTDCCHFAYIMKEIMRREEGNNKERK